MTDFAEALFEMLPVKSALNSPRNPGRRVIDDTVGAWFDNYDILEFYNQLFLDTATGRYLDLFGEDYGVYRRLNETDKDYLQRIICEKYDNLTPSSLALIFGLKLYSYVPDFNPVNNDLTSDNPYINGAGYMAEADADLQTLINKKFILGEGVHLL